MGSFGIAEWAIIIVILVLFFGAKRIPGMARGLAQGYVEFKKAKEKDPEEMESGSESSKTPSGRTSSEEEKREA
ncbi:MAG: Sec-independent protein translocase subunit TatA/TatB [Bacteroidota bacterium]